ncbi:hypothetical protein HTZ84_22605 [Haloterrigena sp. SYSU A558-1]|uniref:Uncharacterized protein n=1 Tax=Haloterrigena gelatinilytica TaxID=2741724 RepID=A0ABX2LKF2_9EURY|nr:hypothetical protein [Haloterrigena gelatinilytica]NUC75060.1 hypothetical protein [Haloterrigena gelatinilytica]
MQFNRSTVTTLLMVALVSLSAIGAFAGGAAAAEPTVDSDSDLQDTGTWVDFNASADDTKQINYTNTDAQDGALVVWDPATGSNASDAQVHAEFDNSSDEFYVRNSTADEYGFNISGDDLETVPMEAGENKTVKFTIANQSDWEDDAANLTTMDVTLDNTMERSVMYLGDHQVENEAYGLSHSNDEGYELPVVGMTMPFTGEQKTSMDTTRDIDGSNTTVYTYLANDSVQSQFNDNFGSLDSGAWSDDTLAQLGDGAAVKAYANSLPDDFSNDTSALKYDTSGSTDALVLELGEEHDGESQVDMQVNSDPGLRALFGAYGLEAFGLGSFSLGVLVLFGSRRRYGGVREAVSALRN